MTDDRPPADEEALVASALAGDDGALGRLLSMHQQSAYNVAFRLLGSEADARDAVQEAFLLTVRAVRGEGAPPRDIARFEPWLRRVAANAALGELRRRPSFRPGPVDENADPVSTGEYGDPALPVLTWKKRLTHHVLERFGEAHPHLRLLLRWKALHDAIDRGDRAQVAHKPGEHLTTP